LFIDLFSDLIWQAIHISYLLGFELRRGKNVITERAFEQFFGVSTFADDEQSILVANSSMKKLAKKIKYKSRASHSREEDEKTFKNIPYIKITLS
jgi:hypothetical protein